MLAILAKYVPASCLAKLQTFDVDASALTASQIQEKPDLVLVDAEHTNTAVFIYFLYLYRYCGPSTIFVFHDASLVVSGLQNIETFLLPGCNAKLRPRLCRSRTDAVQQ
jgi:hypothetical protein